MFFLLCFNYFPFLLSLSICSLVLLISSFFYCSLSLLPVITCFQLDPSLNSKTQISFLVLPYVLLFLSSMLFTLSLVFLCPFLVSLLCQFSLFLFFSSVFSFSLFPFLFVPVITRYQLDPSLNSKTQILVLLLLFSHYYFSLFSFSKKWRIKSCFSLLLLLFLFLFCFCSLFVSFLLVFFSCFFLVLTSNNLFQFEPSLNSKTQISFLILPSFLLSLLYKFSLFLFFSFLDFLSLCTRNHLFPIWSFTQLQNPNIISNYLVICSTKNVKLIVFNESCKKNKKIEEK